MDLSLLQRTAAMREEEEEIQSQLSKRPKLSFSVASLLASAARPRSPEDERREEEEEMKDEEEQGLESDEESDVSVDSHGEEEAGLLYNSRLNDSSEMEGADPCSPLSPRPVSPPRSEAPQAPHPRLAMPTPLLGRGFPGLPPGVQLGGAIFPPGWPGMLPPGLQGLNPNLFKSGITAISLNIGLVDKRTIKYFN